MPRFVVDVDLALVRPPKVDVTSRWCIIAPDASTAERDAISCATQVWNAEMPIGSTIVEWEE